MNIYIKSQENNFSGYFFVLLAALCWSLTGPLAKFAFKAGISPQEVAFWRASFGGMFFLIHALIAGLLKVTPKERIIFSAFGIIGVAIQFSCFQIAVREGGAALASILQYTAPAWVIVFSCLLFKESFTLIKALAVALAMFGAALTSLSGGGLPTGTTTLGIACGLISGFTYSLHYVFSKKYLSKHSPITLYAHCLPMGALCLFPITEFAPKAPADWLPLLSIGLVGTYAAYWAYCIGMTRLSATRVAVTANLEPVAAALLAWWLWGELFSPLGLVGTACVLGAICLIIFSNAKR